MSGPSDERFEQLFQNLHKYKASAVELKKKAMLENNKVKQPPCAICGKWHGSANQHFIAGFKPELYCPTCKKALKDGCTAFVSLDNRFAIVKINFANEEQRKAAEGQILTVTNERMDELQKSNKGAGDKLENN